MQVYIDGILQISGFDYAITGNAVSFTYAPGQGSQIELHSGSIVVARLLGDGRTFLFRISKEGSQRHALLQLLDDAVKYRDKPAVAEALEKLIVAIELVKE